VLVDDAHLVGVEGQELAQDLGLAAAEGALEVGEDDDGDRRAGIAAHRGVADGDARAGGAGIPAFYTPTGVGTLVAEGKETRTIDGRDYLLERGIVGDFSLVAAWKGDRLGNLVYRKAARNFNPMAVTCGRVSIAEVEELVEPGQLDPENVHTPGIFVDRVVVAPRAKRIERRTVRK
jgi:acyl CoA:acetate/3-ketoacid CoA transferase